MSVPFTCAARRYGAVMACGRCGLRWTSPEDAPAACSERAEPPIGLDEIRAVVTAAAEDIDQKQEVLVALREDASAHGDTRMVESLRNAPRLEELRKAAVLRAAAGLVDRIEG